MCEGRKGLGEKSHEWRLSSDLQTLLIALWNEAVQDNQFTQRNRRLCSREGLHLIAIHRTSSPQGRRDTLPSDKRE